MAQVLEAAVQEAASSHKQFSAAIDVSQNLETLLTEARAATGTISAEHTEESKTNAATKKQLAVLKKALAILKPDEERKKSASLQSSSNQMEENATMKENELACKKVEQLEKELINTRAEIQALKKRPAERRQIMKSGEVQ